MLMRVHALCSAKATTAMSDVLSPGTSFTACTAATAADAPVAVLVVVITLAT
jgi:hypothetical protein